MAYLLFLGAVFFLGCYFYEYLKRFFSAFLEYHPLCDWIARVSYFGPANSILAGQDAVWSDEIHGYRLKIVHGSSSGVSSGANISETTEIDVNDNPTVVTESSKNKYLASYESEEKDMARKEKLYLSALNRDRPRKHPKIRKLPKVGYLPTIFEPLPYPVTLASLMQPIDEEEEERTVILESPENTLSAEPISVANEERISDETTDVNTDQPNPASTQPAKNKKKKFPKIRGFFKKFSRGHR